MNTKIIERAFESYRDKVLNPDAGTVQVEESRKAFFGGAVTLFTALMFGLSDGDEPQQSDEDLMQSIQDELDEFSQTIEREAFYGKPN